MNNKHFILRPLKPEDAPNLHAIMLNPAVYATLVRVPSIELAEVEAWTRRKTNGRYRLVIEHNNQAIALGTLTHIQRPRRNHTGMIGMYVSYEYWGQGVGSMLLAGLLDVADNWLNLSRLELDVFTENHAAVRLYEKHGFEIEGRRPKVAYGNGQWLDEFAMARLRNVPSQRERVPNNPAKHPKKPAPKSLHIRPYLASDIPTVHQLMTSPSVSRTTLQLPAFEESHYASRSEPNPHNHRLMADVDGTAVGMISIHVNPNPRMSHSAGLGMSVHPDYWGIGIGSKLMSAILDLADNWLNLKRIELDVNLDNPAGIRLYKKFGFEIEGTKRLHAFGDGRWADSYFMGRIR